MPPYNRPYVSPLAVAAQSERPTLSRDLPRVAALDTARQPYSATASDMGGVRIVPTSGPAPASAPAEASGTWYDRQVNALRPRLEEAAQGYGGALQAAREGQAASYDDMKRFQEERIAELSKPQGSDVWGYYGAALAAPTTTGSFGEAMSNAAKAGLAQKAAERDAAERRDEKLAASKMALARMMAEKPNAQLDQFRDTLDEYKTVNEIGGYVSDMGLGNGLTPQGDQALLADYAANPRKYAGARGQQMIADAQGRVTAATKTADERKWWMTQQDVQSRLRREEEAAKAAVAGSKPQPLDRAEANRVAKRKAELMNAAESARGLDGTLSQLESARNRTNNEGTPGSTLYSNWFGWMTDEASAGQEVAAQATRLKLQLSESLKGAISNSEQEMLDRATPGMSMTDDAAANSIAGYRAATQRAKERAAFYETWVRTHGDDYGSDTAWDQYVQENPILDQDESGALVVNNRNIGNWREYIGQPEGGPAQGLPATGGQGGGQPKPGYDLGLQDLEEGDVVEDEGGARYIIRGGQPVRIGE